MITVTNIVKSKSVHIKPNKDSFIALYIQTYQGEQQVIQEKFFTKVEQAQKWAFKKLA